MVKDTEEVWKDIKGYHKYQVSNLGRVKNKISGQILRPGLGGVGYLTVALYQNGRSTTVNVHKLVCEAFIGEIPKGYTVNHKDGCKTNNTVPNLEVVTRKENNRHAFDTGLNQHRRPVRIVETGEVFKSLEDCAAAISGDTSNICTCLNGRLKTHKGLHFEPIDINGVIKDTTPNILYDFQFDAVENAFIGSIFNGGTGSGKSRTGIYFYFKSQGGYYRGSNYIPMKNPKDLYIITTAAKRDKNEWEEELSLFRMSTNPKLNYYSNRIIVDSWNNIKKYTDLENMFIIFDEDKACGSGVWAKSFVKIAKKNDWIMLSATTGDQWMDYWAVFVANGFYKNKSEFIREHVIYSRYSKYPKIEKYINTERLMRLRNKILIDMNVTRHTIPHHEDVYCNYDIKLYKDAVRNRWDPYRQEPIKQASELCYLLRKIVNSDESRQVKLLEILEDHPRVIIFYSYDYEREILLNLGYGDDVEIAEWTGHKHQPIPESEKWVYLCNYQSGAEGFNCTSTNTIVFFSQTYSYKTLTQAVGRVDRLNTKFVDLYYYHLKSRSGIDLAISKALKEKRKFNETKWLYSWDKHRF